MFGLPCGGTPSRANFCIAYRVAWVAAVERSTERRRRSFDEMAGPVSSLSFGSDSPLFRDLLRGLDGGASPACSWQAPTLAGVADGLPMERLRSPKRQRHAAPPPAAAADEEVAEADDAAPWKCLEGHAVGSEDCARCRGCVLRAAPRLAGSLQHCKAACADLLTRVRGSGDFNQAAAAGRGGELPAGGRPGQEERGEKAAGAVEQDARVELLRRARGGGGKGGGAPGQRVARLGRGAARQELRLAAQVPPAAVRAASPSRAHPVVSRPPHARASPRLCGAWGYGCSLWKVKELRRGACGCVVFEEPPFSSLVLFDARRLQATRPSTRPSPPRQPACRRPRPRPSPPPLLPLLRAVAAEVVRLRERTGAAAPRLWRAPRRPLSPAFSPHPAGGTTAPSHPSCPPTVRRHPDVFRFNSAAF